MRRRLLAGRIFGGVSGAVTVAPYAALVKLGDVLLSAHSAGVAPDDAEVATIVRLLIAAFSVQLLLMLIGLTITHFADLKLMRILRTRIVERVSRAPLSWFGQATSGRVRKAVQNDAMALHTLVAHAPVETAAAIVAPLALAIYAFVIDCRLGLLAIASVPVYLGIQALTIRGMGEKTALMDSKLSDVSATAVEFTNGITVVKAFGTAGRSHARYSSAVRTFSRFYLDWVGPMMRISSSSEAFISVPLLLLLNVGVGSLLIRAGTVTPADVAASSLIALILPAAIQVIGNNQASYQMAAGAALRLRETLDAPELAVVESASAAAGAEEDAGGSGMALAVSFENVTFGYDGNPVLRGVSADLGTGTVTALIGESGSGKSTLAGLLARFHDPDSGCVRLGGRDMRTLSSTEIYAQVAFVLQDPQLLRLSIRDNIRLARPTAGDDAIRRAVQATQLANEIRALPHGLDTIVHQDVELSGGQAQRLSIARALLADAPVLILDEALTASDPDAQAQIQQARSQLVVGRTVLVITHRPESVYGADQVIELERGAVATVLRGEEVTNEAVDALMGSHEGSRL